MKKYLLIIFSFLIFNLAHAGMSNNDKSKAWECSGIYMANYFLPSGEEFEYSMKEKSMASVKVMKSYALEVGILEKEWDEENNLTLCVKSGSIVIFNGSIAHKSSENLSEQSRNTYVLHFFDNDTVYSKENWLQRPNNFPFRDFIK